MFLDKVRLIVRSGKGGNGAVCFRREKFVPKGGPSGGDGGKGGDVVLRVDNNINNLYHLRHTPTIRASNGENGREKKKHGKKGKDVIIKIPPGTSVFNENGKLLYDLLIPGEEKIIAHGGKGGKGNVHFATSKNRSPDYAKSGKPSEEKKIVLELKSIADVGIVGYPNVGKSTLLSRISSATPKIARYPFTTLYPNLGVVEFEDFTHLTFADIPGVIEDASLGKGLGLSFLRHIERTKLLLILLDISSESIEKDYLSILNELSNYSRSLIEYPRVVAINKIDLQKGKIKKLELEEEIIYISALKQIGLATLIEKILEIFKNIGGKNGKENKTT